MSTPQSSRREAMRAQQQAQEAAARRRKIITIVAGVVALVVIAGVVIAALTRSDGKTNDQVTPPGADAATGAITVKPDKVSKDAPTVTVYQDYQCPVCKQVHMVFGPSLDELASQGKIRLQYRTLTFLDDNLHNDASYRAAMAAAAADVVGHYEKYHDTVFANQPASEGQGYTDEQLRDTFARDAGITGSDLTKFQKLYDDRALSDFVKNAADKGLEEGTKLSKDFGTPAFTVDGKLWNGWRTLADRSPEGLLKAIQDAAKQS